MSAVIAPEIKAEVESGFKAEAEIKAEVQPEIKAEAPTQTKSEIATEVTPESYAKQLKPDGRLACIYKQGPAAKAMIYRLTEGRLVGRPLTWGFDPVFASLFCHSIVLPQVRMKIR